MDKRSIWIGFSLILITLFFINFFINLILPNFGNNPLTFLMVSFLCILFCWYSEQKKERILFISCANITLLLFVFFSPLDYAQKLKDFNLQPSLGNYILIFFTHGIRNFSVNSLFNNPGALWYILFNYSIVYIFDLIKANTFYLKKKLKEALNSIKETNKFKTDIERYEKTIDELQGKIVELSSRTLVLKEFASEIGSSFEPKRIFNSIIEATIKLIDSEQTMVLIFDKNKDLKISTSHNVDKEKIKNLKINGKDGIIGMILKNRSIITKDDIKKNFQLTELHKMDKVDIEIAAPVESEEGQVYAVLVINKMKSRITKEHIRMFSILLNISTLSLENSKLFKKVEFMANVDGLTKLYTHRFFQEYLTEELGRATRYKRPLAVIMSDIDHFKGFNDTYGHQIGDLVLENVAKVFKQSVRNKVDLVARYGGEEFIAVLPETDEKSAYIVAERVRENIENLVVKSEKGEKFKVTVSLGISGFPKDSTEKMELIKKADTALYYAKESGRNKVCIFSADKMKDEH
ncbi:MAG: GGDEF domain-containing protein [Candidatus Muiribacteriota bacterium]